MRGPDLKIDGVALVQMRSSAVYAWRRGDEYLYVGESANGLGRPLGCHHVIAQAEDIQPHDVLEVWYFNDGQEASAFEQHQIERLRPRYNSMIGIDRKASLHETTGVGPPCKTIKCRMCQEPFTQSIWYQVECLICSKSTVTAKKAERIRKLKADRLSGAFG